MSNSTAVLRRILGPSRRRLWQAIGHTREESRTQFFGGGQAPRARQSHTQFFGDNETAEKLLGELAKSQSLQNDRIVIFLEGQKYVVPRSKLLEWDSI
jgi:hypothetical protein